MAASRGIVLDGTSLARSSALIRYGSPAFFRPPFACRRPTFPWVLIRLSSSFTRKPRARQGFLVNGGVVNLNGIKHTKASHCSSQITGNLQGISLRFSPPYHHVYLELLSLPKNPSQNYQGI